MGENSKSVLSLQNLLLEIFNKLQPSYSDNVNRLIVIHRVNSMVARLHSCNDCLVVPFGSYESNLYSPWGDLDLSIQVPPTTSLGNSTGTVSRSRKSNILNKMFYVLRGSGMATNMEIIRSARVPVIYFVDKEVRVSCDVSVDNDGGCIKSRVLGWISEIDERCRQLMFLVKCWAKAQKINDPKQGSFNSYALCQLVIFHLQTCSPPVLPPLTEIIGTNGGNMGTWGSDTRELYFASCRENIRKLKDVRFSSRNQDSLAKLFSSFFFLYSRMLDPSEKDWAVCTLTGTWGNNSSICQQWKSKKHLVTVEDPFDPTQNCARSVQASAMSGIRTKFLNAAVTLQSSGSAAPASVSNLRMTLFRWPESSRYPQGIVSLQQPKKAGVAQYNNLWPRQKFPAATLQGNSAKLHQKTITSSEQIQKQTLRSAQLKAPVQVKDSQQKKILPGKPYFQMHRQPQSSSDLVFPKGAPALQNLSLGGPNVPTGERRLQEAGHSSLIRPKSRKPRKEFAASSSATSIQPPCVHEDSVSLNNGIASSAQSSNPTQRASTVSREKFKLARGASTGKVDSNFPTNGLDKEMKKPHLKLRSSTRHIPRLKADVVGPNIASANHIAMQQKNSTDKNFGQSSTSFDSAVPKQIS